MFLTATDLEALTGRKRWRSQVQWLQTHGYRHDLTAAGRPVVLREEVERHMLGSDKKRAAQPRLDLLRSDR